MRAIRLRILAFLASKGPDPFFVDLLDVLFNCFLDRYFNLVFLALIDVTVHVYEGCLPWGACEETKVTELVSRQHLIVCCGLLVLNHW